MRSSSVKTLVSAVTLTFTLIVAAPPAEARTSQPKRPSPSAPSMADRAQRAARQLLKRFFGISANDEVTVPIPRLARTWETELEAVQASEPVPQNP